MTGGEVLTVPEPGDRAYMDVLVEWDGSRWVSEEQGLAVESVQRWMALALWQAFGLDPQEFEAYIDANSWADTWSRLLDLVRREPFCMAIVDTDDLCVLREGHDSPHYGTKDVGPPNDLIDKLARQSGDSGG